MSEMWRRATPSLKVNSVSKPAKPFSLVPIASLCQALMFSMCTQDCQPLEKPQLYPASISFFEAASISDQVSGTDSTPASAKASLLYQSTGVELLNGSESRSPSGVV